jgi:hypothetical protein
MPTKKDNRYQADFRFNHKRYRRTFDTLSEAAAWEENTLKRLKEGVSPEVVKGTGTDTMQSLLDSVEKHRWRGSKGEVSAMKNAQDCVDLLGAATQPRSVKTSDVDRLVETWITNGLAGGTINRKLAALSYMLRWAHRRGIIEQLPAIERRKEAEVKLRWYSETEEATLAGWFESHGYHEYVDILTFLIDTGARLGELERVTFGDISDTYMTFAETKSGKPRSVPMTDRVLELVARRRGLSIAPADQPLLLPASRKTLQAVWARALKACGIQGANIHTCRHTCASRLVQAGVSLQITKEWLGHSSFTTTLRYAHLAPATLLSGLRALQKDTDQTTLKMQHG